MKYKTKLQSRKGNGEFPEFPSFDEPELGYLERQNCTSEIDIFLDEEIKDPRYYRAVIHRLITGSEADFVRIFVNSPGGNLNGGLALIDAIQNSACNILGIITGEAASAASLIALHCPELIVSDNAKMLAHQASYGIAGNASFISQNVKFNEKLFDKVMQDAYEDFLTEEEIQKVKSGLELWMFADEIEERLEKRNELRHKRFEEAQAEAKQQQQEQPKKKPSKKAIDKNEDLK